MRSLLSPLALALAFGAATVASAQSPGKLNVSVAGVRNDNGSVRCGLYSSANGFREPGREMRGAGGADQKWAGDLRVQWRSGGNLRDRGIPRRAQRDADGDRPVRQAQAGLRLLNNPSSTFGPPGFESAAFTYNGGTLQLPVRLSY